MHPKPGENNIAFAAVTACKFWKELKYHIYKIIDGSHGKKEMFKTGEVILKPLLAVVIVVRVRPCWSDTLSNDVKSTLEFGFDTVP